MNIGFVIGGVCMTVTDFYNRDEAVF